MRREFGRDPPVWFVPKHAVSFGAFTRTGNAVKIQQSLNFSLGISEMSQGIKESGLTLRAFSKIQ